MSIAVRDAMRRQGNFQRANVQQPSPLAANAAYPVEGGATQPVAGANSAIFTSGGAGSFPIAALVGFVGVLFGIRLLHEYFNKLLG